MYWPSTSNRHLIDAASARGAQSPASSARATRSNMARGRTSREFHGTQEARNETKVLRPRPLLDVIAPPPSLALSRLGTPEGWFQTVLPGPVPVRISSPRRAVGPAGGRPPR